MGNSVSVAAAARDASASPPSAITVAALAIARRAFACTDRYLPSSTGCWSADAELTIPLQARPG
jgi:hypothetical protein